MIKRCFLALLCLAAPLAGFSQIRVELEFEQETYLPQEPLHAVVRIYNSSGQTLVLGKDGEWLSFTVDSVDGSVVQQKKPVEVEGEFTLPSASRAKKMVNLAQAFELNRQGRYNVTATVHLSAGDWRESFSSRPRHFGISPGSKLWESAFGLPADPHESRPEMRKYQLLQANHLKELTLYVRVTDEAEAETFALFTLGKLLGISRPEPQLDRWNNLHVFYQNSARGFLYNVLTPEGQVLTRQTWEIGESRPTMVANAEGRISVRGGQRRISATDLPPPELLSENTPAEPAAPLAAGSLVDAKKPVQ